MSLQHLLRVNLPVDLVLRLLQLAPNIVVVQGNFGNLPLHIHSMWIWRLSHHNHIVTGGVPRGCAGAELLFTVTALDVALYSGSSPSVVEMLLETWGIPTGCASTRSSWTASPHNSVRYKNSLKIYTDKVTSGQPRRSQTLWWQWILATSLRLWLGRITSSDWHDPFGIPPRYCCQGQMG
jgi:hypothetical protein